MPYFLKGNCVWSGTKEEPDKEIKCHEDHDAAMAHMKALYANVEDAEEKGGRGSGWHNPPEGTHTAENAPNFAGGPGADREYGTESDEPPKGSKRCKCSKCGAVIVLPKGKQCEDIKCPSCGRGSTQEVPREDKPAEGEGGRNPKAGREKAIVGDLGSTIHGQGGSIGEVSSVMDDGSGDTGCKCPKCGKDLPCTAKACPHCKESVDVERGDTDKRATKSEGDGDHPASHYLVVEDPEKPTTWHLRIRNAQGELDHTLMGGAWAALHGGYRGNKYAGPNKDMALAKLKELYKREGMDTPSEKSDEKSTWMIYKGVNDEWRWMTLSNWAVVDKEKEVVSEQAYRDAIAYAQKANDWGQLDLVHVNGTDVGDCDQLFVLKSGNIPPKFGAGGTWHDTAKATKAREAIQADPEHWGVSLKFRFNPQRFVRGIYTGDIQVLKHSILPQDMAASYGTAIAVAQGGNQMKALDEKAAEALRQLGHTEDEIAELAEKQKALPDEVNVVEKEDTTVTEVTPERSTIWTELGKMLGIGKDTPVAASEPDEARKAEEVTEPATTAEPAEETKAEGETPVAEKNDEPEVSALLPVLGEAIAKSVGEMVKAELDVRDKRIANLEAQISGLSESVEEKVEQRLRDLPQVVKVAASQVEATAVDDKPKGLRFGRQPDEVEKFTSALLEGIKQVVEDKTGAQFQV